MFDIEKANQIAFERLQKAEPHIVDLGIACEVIPEWRKTPYYMPDRR